ncbi:MAG: hemolysin III family protein [Firmicutes bacterium]|nr:hemolysin III family protein [Bacillota bacterium]
MVKIRELTKEEELVNTISHGIGVCLAIPALVVLIIYANRYGNMWHRLSFTIFGVSQVFLYIASTLYHGFPKGKAKKVLKIIDHACIYLLIAGSYTPITLITLRESIGIHILGIIWTVAILGIIYKIFYINKHIVFSTLLYVAMGFFILVAIKPIIAGMNSTGFKFLVAGGFFYSVGTIFFALQQIKYNHAIWHFFVLAGSACHFITVLFLLPNFTLFS